MQQALLPQIAFFLFCLWAKAPKIKLVRGDDRWVCERSVEQKGLQLRISSLPLRESPSSRQGTPGIPLRGLQEPPVPQRLPLQRVVLMAAPDPPGKQPRRGPATDTPSPRQLLGPLQGAALLAGSPGLKAAGSGASWEAPPGLMLGRSSAAAELRPLPDPREAPAVQRPARGPFIPSLLDHRVKRSRHST